MGLFSFIKDAGANIFGIGKSTAQEAAEAAANKEAKLVDTINTLGFNVKKLQIEVKDEVVVIRGEAENQEVREKVILVAGNIEGVAAVDDQMTVPVQVEVVPEAQFHTVERGDTLSKIAKKFYGNAMKYPVIFEANKPMLSHPDRIYPGQVLRIPALED